MSVYRRYTSGEAHLIPESSTKLKAIDISPLAGSYQLVKSDFVNKPTESWISIFPNAAYFHGFDPVLFGNVIIMVYESPDSDKICTVSLTKFGVTFYNDLILDSSSRFYPACENLVPGHLESNVRRALAITNLKNYNKLINHSGEYNLNKRWDETNAGHLASRMNLLVDKKPFEFGSKLLEMGLIQSHYIDSLLVDIVYDSAPASQAITDKNNSLVTLLGDQLDQLFDPLLEYSPETLETTYNPPSPGHFRTPLLDTNETITAIVDELLSVQTNYTMGLVGLLQNFIIPLRISVLAKPQANGITKINSIFPPTIDEVTRINCVLHDSLNKAAPFGYLEIIKVFGMVLPYFYKPFIRHEANLKNFSTKLHSFHSKFKNSVFSDPELNKGGLTVNAIDSVVSGSLLELPKLKMILTRLHDAVMNQLASSRADPADKEEETKINVYYYNSAMKVIDAFCGEDSSAQKKKDAKFEAKQRVFTPTGKLLTELASKWPSELQYGWLSRKVIGIFELRNVKPSDENFYDLEILIIFSDQILFLKIIDDNYYLKDSESSVISVADVLMHSLVNEKPLPKLSEFPEMEVSCWASIKNVAVTTYKSYSSRTASEEDYLRFLDSTGEGFKGSASERCKNYEIIREKNGNFSTGNGIIELVNKSKILFKNQPFHLFRSNSSSLHVYSTAHTSETYDAENVKSPIIILLNIPDDAIHHYFETNNHLYFIFSLSLADDDNVHLKGFSRQGDILPDESFPKAALQVMLIRKLEDYINSYFNEFNQISETLVSSTDKDLGYYMTNYRRFNSVDVRSKMKTRVHSKKTLKLKKVNVEKKENLPPTPPEQQSSEAIRRKDNPRRRSFLGRIFSRKKSNRTLFIEQAEQPEPAAVETTPQDETEEAVVETTKYVGLYKPQPTLKRESYIQPTNDDNDDINDEEELLQAPKQEESYQNLNRLEAKEETMIYKTPKVQNKDVEQAVPYLGPRPRFSDAADSDKQKEEVSLDISSKFEFPTTHVAEIAKASPSKAKIYRGDHRNSERVQIEDDSDDDNDDVDDIPRRYVGSGYNMVRNVSETGILFEPQGGVDDDSEANWVAFSRDSSLSDSEFEHARRYMAPVNVPEKEQKVPPKKSVDTLSNFMTRKELTKVPSKSFLFSRIDQRDSSESSLSPSQYANDLAKEMDANFSSSGPNGLKIMEPVSTQATLKTIPSIFQYKAPKFEKPEQPSKIDTSGDSIDRKKSKSSQEGSPLDGQTPITYNTTSEEEFYSPDEFVDVDEVLDSKTSQFITYGSFSSENTIINEMLEKEPLKKLPSPKLRKEDTSKTLMAQIYSGKFDSIAYLTDYLDGKKEFTV